MKKQIRERWSMDLVVAILSMGLLGSAIICSAYVIQGLSDRAWEGVIVSEIRLNKYSYCFKCVALHSEIIFNSLRIAIILVGGISLVFGRRNPGLYSAVFIACSFALLLLVCIVVVIAANEISLLKGPLQLE